MTYSDDYLYSKDIDWFCIIGDVFCHVASAGGLIPIIINDREKLRSLQKRVFDSDFIFDEEEIVVNEDFLDQHFGDDKEARIAYMLSFMSMARKGFVSFDRTNVMDLNIKPIITFLIKNTYQLQLYRRRLRQIKK